MKNPHAQALGYLGGKAGKGPAKARTSEQARKAANTRWAKAGKTQAPTATTALDNWNKKHEK